MADDDFGYTACGRDWVRLAQPIRQVRPDPMLPRARKLARTGGVEVAIKGRTVRGVVQRGRSRSVVLIEVAPMSQETIMGITSHLSSARPILTDEVHRASTTIGVSPAPLVAGADCSCELGTGRCIHVLAVYYEMARRVDDDPQIALEVQGFFRAAPASSRAPAPASPQRWVALHSLDPAGYFTVDPTREGSS